DVLNLLFRVEQVPPEAIPRLVPARLRGSFAPLLPKPKDRYELAPVLKRVAVMSITAFQQSFLVSPTPRERVQRGQFAEGTPLLVETQRRFGVAKERIHNDRSLDEVLEEFAERAREVYTKLMDARAARNLGAIADAEAGVELLWKSQQGVVGALIDLTLTDP